MPLPLSPCTSSQLCPLELESLDLRPPDRGCCCLPHAAAEPGGRRAPLPPAAVTSTVEAVRSRAVSDGGAGDADMGAGEAAGGAGTGEWWR